MDLKKEELHQKQDIEAGFQIDAFRLAQFSNSCDSIGECHSGRLYQLKTVSIENLSEKDFQLMIAR